MLPDDKIYEFECKVQEILHDMNSISMSGDQLTLKGTKRKIVLQAK